MDDTGLDNQVPNHSQAVETTQTGGFKNSFQNVDDAYASRWWFASSAFPMIAGTLGPVASAFSICALVRPWRQHLPPGATIEEASFIKDPSWLIIINALQLGMAIIANLFLLLNMARRVRFPVAQPVTIIGWYISAICLMALAATASGALVVEPAEEYVWSQAFYYGIFAAVLYFVVSTLMVVTVIGAYRGHYAMDFNLTSSQRTLMLQTIMFLMYLLIGALVFGIIEGWSYLDAVYWADVTLFTIGFGDFAMATPLGRALLIPYALIGVISLGLVIGSIRSLALGDGQHFLDARFVEKKRGQMLKKVERKGDNRILKPIHNSEKGRSSQLTEYDRREQEFILMRKIQRAANRRKRWVALAVSLSTLIVLWLVGATVFLECERRYQDWNYYDAFYLAFVSLTTIGYGDRTPISNAGKAFFVFWSLLALPTMTILISHAGDTVVRFVRDTTLHLGNITILPGEHGFKRSFKEAVSEFSCGILFEERIRDTPPGFLGQTDHNFSTDTESEAGNNSDMADGGLAIENGDNMSEKPSSNCTSDPGDCDPYEDTRPGTSNSQTQAIGTSALAAPNYDSAQGSRFRDIPEGRIVGDGMIHRPGILHRTSSMYVVPSRLPQTRQSYHCALMHEISRVIRHSRDQPHRKYSFAEWAWFLALIGEDEASAETHLIAQNDNASEGTNTANGQRVKWSWVGRRSPLMGSLEEPEWVLERLTDRLKDELDTQRREVEGH